MSAIPPIKGVPPEIARVLQPLKESVERIQGQQPKRAKIVPLTTAATTAEIALKVNEILELLQG